MSSRRREGILGLRGGCGREKTVADGAGDGPEISLLLHDENDDDMMGRGEGTACSISGSCFDRAAACVSSCERPPGGLRADAAGGVERVGRCT